MDIEYLKSQVFIPNHDDNKQYNIYDVILLSDKIKVTNVLINDFVGAFSENCWSDKDDNFISVNTVLRDMDKYPEHKARINESDIKYPILIAPSGEIIDGMHRLAKAFLDGETHIKAKRFDKWEDMESNRGSSMVIDAFDISTTIDADLMIQFSRRPVLQSNGKYKIVEPKYTLSTEIYLKKGDLPNVTEDIKTTVGRAIVNKLLLCIPFGDAIPYQNKPIKVNKLINVATTEHMNGTVTVPQIGKMLTAIVWLTRFGDQCIPSTSEKFLYIPQKSKKLRAELMKKHKKLLDAGDISAIELIEKPVLASIVEELKDDPTMKLYSLGKPSVGNHLKQTIGTLSPIYNPSTKKFEFPEGNWSEGIKPESYHLFANMNVQGTFGRAVATQDGGSIVKSLYNTMNPIKCDEHGTDCGSTKTKSVRLTTKNYGQYCWNYIVEGTKTILLTNKNKSMYVGKDVNMRSPLFCNSGDKQLVCNKCVGEIPYKMDIVHVGNLTTKIGFKFVSLSLKGFHDSTVQTTRIDPFEFME